MDSFIEQILNIGSGLFLSALVVQPILFPIYDIQTSTFENIQLALIFTIVSVGRGYLWRRFFVHGNLRFWLNKIKYKIKDIYVRYEIERFIFGNR